MPSQVDSGVRTGVTDWRAWRTCSTTTVVDKSSISSKFNGLSREGFGALARGFLPFEKRSLHYIALRARLKKRFTISQQVHQNALARGRRWSEETTPGGGRARTGLAPPRQEDTGRRPIDLALQLRLPPPFPRLPQNSHRTHRSRGCARRLAALEILSGPQGQRLRHSQAVEKYFSRKAEVQGAVASSF